MFHYSLRVIDEPKKSEIRILNLCHKKTILVDIYRQSLLSIDTRFSHESVPSRSKSCVGEGQERIIKSSRSVGFI